MSSTTSTVRTRFAPSPTGYLHLGGARTALFSWAFARHHGGTFILRIEDTDVERSSAEAVQAILDSMQWLGMEPDEGPFYQMQRLERYQEVIEQLLESGHAYHCYSSPEEIDAMREKARAAGLKPRYDGTWRPEKGKQLPAIPADRKPVVRFKNPQIGATSWEDLVKGPISIDNTELDDLVIARADGTPTYNFCVVVDDWDMKITHVIRGDDHVNNTPRQINILNALNAPLPIYGHVPMILGPDGELLSKRHGAVSVTEYDAEGYLADAMVNYLARLGWSHGDDEIFSRQQFIEWFDGSHLSRSPAQWDPKKLDWVNAQYIRQSDTPALSKAIAKRLEQSGLPVKAAALEPIIDLYKDRANTLKQLAESAKPFFATQIEAPKSLVDEQLTPEALELLDEFSSRAAKLDDWSTDNLDALIKQLLEDKGVRMPRLAIPLRVAVLGQKQTPSISEVLQVLGQKTVLERLAAVTKQAS